VTHGPALIDAIRGERAEPPPGIRTLGLDAAHRWITRLEGGEVDLTWAFDAAYTNAEGAVLCSWTTALADQALFFAATSLCQAGEQTRMGSLSLVCLENITSGPVDIAARVNGRSADRMTGTCTFTLPDGVMAAVVTAVIDVVRE
jgi:acyl-coenzyme A thioesterase PaaI-like protein